MARTKRAHAIPVKNLWPKEEWEAYTHNHGITYERYLATCTNDRRAGRWYPTKEFRQALNRLYRAKAQQAVKKFKADAQFDKDLEIPVKKRDAWWLWF